MAIVASQLMHGLGSEPDVSHHGNSVVRQSANDRSNAFVTFQFRCLATGFLKGADRVLQCRVRVGRGTERKVEDDKRLSRAANDGRRVANHVVHRDGNGIFESQDDISQAVSD